MQTASNQKRFPWTRFPRTAGPAGGNSWNPETHPYRVTWFLRDGGRGMSGWSSHHRLFADEAEVRALVEEPMGAAFEVIAERISEDRRRWLRVASRKRRPSSARPFAEATRHD